MIPTVEEYGRVEKMEKNLINCLCVHMSSSYPEAEDSDVRRASGFVEGCRLKENFKTIEM